MISALVFQNQGGFPRLGASLPERDEYLRFTFSAALADLFGVQHAVLCTLPPTLPPSNLVHQSSLDSLCFVCASMHLTSTLVYCHI